MTRILETLTRLRRQFKDQGKVFGKDPRKGITEEVVESVVGETRYRVKGAELTTTGEAQLAAGEKVHVAWADGRRQVILRHQARRAQFRPNVARLVIRGIPEELLIIEDQATLGREIFFRNVDTFKSLNIRAQVTGDIIDVEWGTRADSFVVTTEIQGTSSPFTPGQLFAHVFTLNRDSDQALEEGVGAGLVATLLRTEIVSDSTVPLATVGFSLSRTGSYKAIDPLTFTQTFNFLGSTLGCVLSLSCGPITVVSFGNTASQTGSQIITVGAIAAGGPTTPGFLGGEFGLVGFQGLAGVPGSKFFLNDNLDLIAVLNLEFSNFVPTLNPISGSLTRIAGAVGSVGSPPGTCIGTETIAPPQSLAGISDNHVVVVNLTTGAILFSTMEDGTTTIVESNVRGSDRQNLQTLILSTDPICDPLATGSNCTVTRLVGADPTPECVFDIGLFRDETKFISKQDLFKTTFPFIPATTYPINVSDITSKNGLGTSGTGSHEITHRDIIRTQGAANFVEVVASLVSVTPLILFLRIRDRIAGPDVESAVALFAETGQFITLFPATVGANLVEFITGNSHRILFKQATGTVSAPGPVEVRMVSLDTGEIKTVATSEATFNSHLFRLLQPDFLYALAEKNLFFVVSEEDGLISLVGDAASLEEQRDFTLDEVDDLLRFVDIDPEDFPTPPSRTSGPQLIVASDLHAVNDQEVLEQFGAFQEE